MADAQIILTLGQARGILALVNGEEYRRAQTVLDETGFRPGEDGIYQLGAASPAAARAAVSDLSRRADLSGVRVTMSGRHFIGDTARDIAHRLPGTWTARVAVYEHPVWQEDLVPWVWDSGELGQAVQNARIPYAAFLTNLSTDTRLLLVERPGHPRDHLVGAFAPSAFFERPGAPHAPRSVVAPSSPGRAAQAIAERFLPAYDRAVHNWRADTVAEALSLIHAKLSSWRDHRARAWSLDASPADVAVFGEATSAFLDTAWREFHAVMHHAPALLDRCRPASTAWPQDARPLDLLARALLDTENTREDVDAGALSPAEHPVRIWRAIETWLTHRETFQRQARAAAPRPPTAPALPAPPPALPPGPHTPRR
ncbi:hypothetical protein J7I94_02075 [Streptomyces sp. ISL-12]|uniref:hypothetical protein n=1 Tax=Streptomyces sp. ISL-12 TaxID=2819177 RepID=UPI001BE6BF30|nr:hypothetical protein [Streptomyces sp. ISL-12]MBT2409359.1 hypothetical protein [Streptomyces sp. ISL-12]